MTKLYYIADVRLPTERAHGLQIMKMCEEFAKAGQSVTLVVPDKINHVDSSDDPFLYYGIERNFEIKKLGSMDFLGRTLSFGKLLYRIDALLFLLRLFFLKLPPDSFIYARNPDLLRAFSSKHQRVVELHSLEGISIASLSRADRMVVLTSIMKKELVRMGIPESNIMVAPDAVDVKKFDIPVPQSAARERVGLPQGKKIVLYTGHLYVWKGADTLAEAAKEFGDDILFVFIGGVEPELSIFRKTHERSNIKILPFAKHEIMPYYMKAADVVVIPNSGKSELSKSYTSPLKLFEYMASGIPIVASDLPSLREILTDKNCFFAQPDNPHSLATTIKEAIGNPEVAETRARQAFADVENHTWEKRVKNIVAYIKAKP